MPNKDVSLFLPGQKPRISIVVVSLIDLQGFRLRLVGHSLGGATASLLAIMIRKKSPKELGFSPDIVSAIGFATPPCVSKELAERCSEYVTTVVMQVDNLVILHNKMVLLLFLDFAFLYALR